MKVLWICSNPVRAARLLGVPPALGCGWMAALEGALEELAEIDLDIAFPWHEPRVRRIESGRHGYLPFPAYPRGGRLRQLLFDVSCRLDPDSEVDHLLRAIELSQPEMIHVWGTEDFYGLVAERSDLPVLIELHGLRGACADAYCSGLSRVDLLLHGSPKRLVNGRSLLHTYYRYRRTAVRERRILAAARYISGRTRWDRELSTAMAPGARYFHADRVLREPFYRAAWKRREGDGELRLVSTLRGNAYKGVEVVARCAELLGRRYAGRLRWTLAGIRKGEEIHRIVERKLGVSFDQLGIRLPGRLAAEEVARRLVEADLFVHPSWIDNSPNSVGEAMLVGIPLIATRVGGIPSLVEDGEDGLLVSAGEPGQLADAVLRLAADHDLGDRLAAAARRRARRRHDPAAVAASVVEIYRQVVAGD